MTAEQNVALVRRLIAAMNVGDTEMISQHLTDDFIRHDLVGVVSMALGRDGLTAFVSELRTGLPDLRVEIDDIFGSDDRVAVRGRTIGTHTGKLFGVEPTGREVEFSGINIYRTEDGKVAETWQHVDWHSALAVLGVGQAE